MTRPTRTPGHFAKLPYAYIDILSPTARCVWMGMFRLADWTTWRVEAGTREIAERSNVSKSATSRAIAEMVNAKVLTIERMPHGHTPGIYVMQWPKDAKNECPGNGHSSVPQTATAPLSVPQTAAECPANGQSYITVSDFETEPPQTRARGGEQNSQTGQPLQPHPDPDTSPTKVGQIPTIPIVRQMPDLDAVGARVARVLSEAKRNGELKD